MAKHGAEYLGSASKRRLDVLGACALGLVLSPLVVGSAVATCVDRRSLNPFFRQQRIGREGMALKTLKFQTIDSKYDNEEEILGTFDPRATKVAQFMRRYGLDELPQLASVLGGSMSLVGFRPLLEKSLNDYEEADDMLFDKWMPYFELSKPGLVSSSSLYRHTVVGPVTPEVCRRSMELDIKDAELASLSHDARLLAHTPLGLIRANLAVDPDTIPTLSTATEMPGAPQLTE